MSSPTVPPTVAELRLELAEFASVNRDGTFTIVRGGITFWDAPLLPVHILASLFAEASPGTFEAGRHAILGKVMQGDQTLIMLAGDIEVTRPQLPMRFAAPLMFNVQAYGNVRVELTIGDVTGTITLEVRSGEVTVPEGT